MPIYIEESPEPLSPAALDRGRKCVLIPSDGSRLLQREMLRYCKGEVAGRSFLIAGHRGSGKTTMVANAFLETMEKSAASPFSMRPLLVWLHGPSLFYTRTKAAPSEAKTPSDKTKAASPGKDTLLGEAKTISSADNDPRPQTESDPANAASGKDSATGEQKKTDFSQTEHEAIQALEQIILALHRSVADHYAKRFRQALGRIIPISPDAVTASTGRRLGPDWAELAICFERDLYECPDDALLRAYWARAFPNLGDDENAANELLVISGACQAHRRISGKYEKTELEKESEEKANKSSFSFDPGAAKLLSSVVTLLTGGMVGSAIFAGAQSGPLAVLGGVLSALAASVVLRISSERSGTRSRTQEERFSRDLSATTLDRVVRNLIDRLHRAGLAPIFVVDELDKVDQLSRLILGMVHYLKKLVAENAFFCFLTDRTYYEEVVQRSNRIAYPVEYTYYTQMLFVSFSARDMHEYLRGRTRDGVRDTGVLQIATELPSDPQAQKADLNFGTRAAMDKTDFEILPYVLLHRSELHPLDLKRLLGELRAPSGAVRLRPGEILGDAYRLDVRIEVAIEMMLDKPVVRQWISRDPERRRLIHDAFFYPSRSWKDEGKPMDLTDEAKGHFGEYLSKRIGTEGTAPEALKMTTADVIKVDDVTRDFLLNRVRELASVLSDEGLFVEEWKQWRELKREDGTVYDDTHFTAVEEALRLDRSEPLLRETESNLFAWNYNRAGLWIGPSMEEEADQDESVAFLRTFEKELAKLFETDSSARTTSQLDLNFLQNDAKVLSLSPPWSETKRALDRLESMGEKYEGRAGDQQSVRAFVEVLRREMDLVHAAVCVSGLITVLVPGPSSAESIRKGLEALRTGCGFDRYLSTQVRPMLIGVAQEASTAYKAPFSPQPTVTKAGDIPRWAGRLKRGISRIDSWKLEQNEELRQEVKNRAWDSLNRRLEAFPRTTEASRPRFEELACGMAGLWTASKKDLFLTSQFAGVTMAEWSRVVMNAIRDRKLMPDWLPTHALRLLGFGFDPTGLKESADEPFPFLMKADPQKPLAGGAMLIIPDPGGSFVESWLPSRSTVAALALTAEELRFLFDRAPKAALWPIRPSPAMCAIEQQPRFRPEIDPELIIIRFFRSTPDPEEAGDDEFVVAPKGVDDLFNAERHSPRGSKPDAPPTDPKRAMK